MAQPSISFSSAAAYVDGVVGGAVAPFRWSDLESSAFARLPDLHRVVVAAGADLDHTENWFDHARAAGWLLVLFAPLTLPPLTGLALGDAGAWLYVVGLISAAHIAMRLREWRRTWTGGPRVTTQEALLAVFNAGFAAVSAGMAAVAAVVKSSPGYWLLCAGLAALALVCAVSFHVAKRAAKRGVPEFSRAAYAEVLALVAELDELDRVAVRADLDRALGRLADAGVISRAQLDEAHGAPLGSLARRIWALERSPARQAR